VIPLTSTPSVSRSPPELVVTPSAARGRPVVPLAAGEHARPAPRGVHGDAAAVRLLAPVARRLGALLGALLGVGPALRRQGAGGARGEQRGADGRSDQSHGSSECLDGDGSPTAV
jgi:hypothetical protein